MKHVRIISATLIAGFLASPLLCLAQAKTTTAGHVDWARLSSWGVATLLFAGILATSGKSLRQYFSGLLIDARNRYSLARLQMTAWTVLALPSLFVALLGNVLRANNGLSVPVLAIDWTLVALMGISLASFITTPLVLSVKAGADTDPAIASQSRERVAKKDGVGSDHICTQGNLVTKADPGDARISDLVTGEEVGNAATLDLARIQMMAITAIVWLAYAAMIGRIFADGNPTTGWLIGKFPTFDSTLLALLAVSHAGYITGKITPKSAAPGPDPSADLARLSVLATQVDGLSSQVSATLVAGATLISGERQLAGLRNQLDGVTQDLKAMTDKLTTSGAVDGGLDNAEGKLAALTALFRSLVGQGGSSSPSADDPSPNLIRQVKDAVGGAGDTPFSPGDIWLPADDVRLSTFLRKLNLAREDLRPEPYRAFEDVLELVRQTPAPK